MIKSITNFLIFFIFQQLKFKISQIDQNGVKPFCDETLHIYIYMYTTLYGTLAGHLIMRFIPS